MTIKVHTESTQHSFCIKKLETFLNFTFLLQISFETKSAEEQIQQKGWEKLEKGEISQEAIELGNRHIKKIQAAYIPLVSVRLINEEVGFGLFAEEEIPAGAYVGEYTGIVRENNQRYMKPLNHYCYEYPVSDAIGRSHVIDATQGNLTRFINHSYTPNLKPVHVFHEGFYHLIFLSLGKITKGTQLFYNYGKNYWYLRGVPQNLIATKPRLRLI